MSQKYNNKRLGLIFASLLFCIHFACFSEPRTDVEETKNPLGCKSVGYKFEFTTLNLLPEVMGEAQSLFFMYNRTDIPVYLYQMRDENRVDELNLNHTILPHSWAVLSTSEKQLHYACAKKNGQEKYGSLINCASVLKVCEYVRVKYGLNNKGDYWVVGNNSRGGAVQGVINYGIIPR